MLDEETDPFDPAVIRASMGAIFKQILIRATHAEFGQWAQRHQLQVIGASPDGLIDYDQAFYAPPTVLMLGEERSGLSDAQRSMCRQIVRIPMVGSTDSLNLAVAGSLLLYQAFRSVRPAAVTEP